MRVFVTGATGFIGRALTLRLIGAGHVVTAWVRDETKARALLGPEVALASAGKGSGIRNEIERADAVINLAGEPVLGGRWTPARKRALIESRIDLTREITQAIAASRQRPEVLISASAVGYYGGRGDQIVDDDASPGEGFLAVVCRDWEAAAFTALESGVRVFIPRIGIVLGDEGGALGNMLAPFRLGVGGPIGSGLQYVPWIHLHDMVEILAAALEDQRFNGAMIAAAPNPVTNHDLARAIGRLLHRPSFITVPALALRLALGEAAAMLLAGQRVRPRLLEQAGFSWRFPTVEAALADILTDHRPQIQHIDKATPQEYAPSNSDYLRRHRARFVLTQKTVVDAPIEEVFHFFSQPQNLGVMTPTAMQFRILGALPKEISRDLRIDYQLQLGPVPLKWRTCIEEWEPPRHFADSQESGPYSCWWHDHRFVAEAARTLMEDRVYYSPPLGPLGAIANLLFVAPALRRIFAYRTQTMRLRFPGKRISDQTQPAKLSG
jgi:uncharacterized protein